MNAPDFIFDVTQFRIDYPQFSDDVKFPDATLQMYWDWATCYISDRDYGFLHGRCRFHAINLMTAHLAALSVVIAQGNYSQIPGIVQSATINKISVSLTPPPLENQWQWWLSLTPYGQQLLALLQVQSVGGFMIGGAPVRSAFRNQSGGFMGGFNVF